MKNIINTDNPIYKQIWESQFEFKKTEDLPEELDHVWPEVHSMVNDSFKDFVQGYYFEGIAGRYIVCQMQDGTFASWVMGPMGEELESFDTLEEAFQASLADYVFETMYGDWDDDVIEYSADGQWMIREVA